MNTYTLNKLVLSFIFLGPLFDFIEKYFWNDWSFLMFMIILVGIDTLTGMLYAWKQHTFSSKKINTIFTKICVYGLTLVTVHAISHHTVNNSPNSIIVEIVPYLDSVMYSFLVFREVLSINENMGKLGYPMLPKWVLRRFIDFDENGLPVKNKDLKDNNIEENKNKV